MAVKLGDGLKDGVLRVADAADECVAIRREANADQTGASSLRGTDRVVESEDARRGFALRRIVGDVESDALLRLRR